MPYVLEMVKGVKAMGMETCMTLGKLDEAQTKALAARRFGLLQPQPGYFAKFYGNIITTRTYAERLQTLSYVRDAGMEICSGGDFGHGRIQLLTVLVC